MAKKTKQAKAHAQQRLDDLGKGLQPKIYCGGKDLCTACQHTLMIRTLWIAASGTPDERSAQIEFALQAAKLNTGLRPEFSRVLRDLLQQKSAGVQ